MSLKNLSVSSKTHKRLLNKLKDKRINQIYKKFENYLDINENFVVAVSGGPDSLALSFLANAKKIPSSLDWLLLSIGTDGIDGPTDAAGGIIDNSSIEALSKSTLDINDFLDNNDSYTFLESINALYKTGPSGTNVADIQIILISR